MVAAGIVRERILDGYFSPGQRLIEAELMTEVEVGRSTLREAFLLLEAEGLVELRHQRGAVVRQLSRDDMRELFQIRATLEGLAAGLAATRIDMADNRRWLEKTRAQWTGDEVLDNEMTHMQRNVPLHEGIIARSGNARLMRSLKPLQIPGYRVPFLRLLDRGYREVSAREHLAIVDAILAGNAARADRLMRAHVERAGRLAQSIPGLR